MLSHLSPYHFCEVGNGWCHCPHFVNGDTEAQRSDIIYLKSHSKVSAGTGTISLCSGLPNQRFSRRDCFTAGFFQHLNPLPQEKEKCAFFSPIKIAEALQARTQTPRRWEADAPLSYKFKYLFLLF